MLKFIQSIGLLIICILLCQSLAKADSDLYSNCIKGYDFGMIPLEDIVLTPINKQCQDTCNNECMSFSRKNSLGIELNKESILNCVLDCQNGKEYTGYYYEEIKVDELNSNNSFKQIVKGPNTTKVTCSLPTQTEGIVYESKMSITKGDKLTISLVTSDQPNKIYLCGRQALNLNPMIESLNPAVWNDKSIPQTVLNERNENMCSMKMSSGNWNSLSNSALWDGSSNEKCSWNVKNSLFVNTKIWVKDNDELSIIWQSTNIYNPSYGLKSDIEPKRRYTRNYLYQSLNDPNFKYSDNTSKSIMQKNLDAQSIIQIMAPGSNILSKNAQAINIVGERARIYKLGEAFDFQKSDPTYLPADAVKFGLKGTVVDNDYKISSKNNDQCNTLDKRIKNRDKCSVIENIGNPTYSFEGILSGFSSTPTLLALRAFNENVNDYSNNIGGIKVSIEFSGCPYSDGQMIQYAIADSKPLDNSTLWLDLPQDVFTKGKNINANSSGKLFLRIKSLTVDKDLPDELKKKYENYAYRSGQYNLALSKPSSSSIIMENGPIKIIVKSIRSTLFGDPSSTNKSGVVDKLFKSLVKESVVMNVIRSILVLYIAFTGLGYLVGTIKMTQNDLIIRLLKFSLVATLISPNGWEFLSKNFFQIFIQGGLELIGLVCQGSLENFGLKAVDISKDPTNIFGVFDGPLRIIISPNLWIKVFALSLSSSLGLVLAIIIPVAAVFYILAIAKATLQFLVSMVITSLLIFVAPLFICFILFANTRQLFDTWWKFLISFTLQPVAIFAAISIFTILIITTIYSTLSFSVCPSCLISINIPLIVNFCLIPCWRMLSYSYFPSDASYSFLPNGLIEGVIVLLILCHAMYIFSEFLASVINLIISGMFLNATNLADYGNMGIATIQSAIGIDQESKNRRIMEEREKESKQKERQNTRLRG